MIICSRCGAMHDGRKWTYREENEKDKTQNRWVKGRVSVSLCPGCLRTKRGEVEGVVTLRGSFLKAHAMEIGNLIRRTAARVSRRNVGARIIREIQDDDGIVIQTTDQHLAEKIGKEVEKAFKGSLRIMWQEQDRFVRVIWERN